MISRIKFHHNSHCQTLSLSTQTEISVPVQLKERRKCLDFECMAYMLGDCQSSSHSSVYFSTILLTPTTSFDQDLVKENAGFTVNILSNHCHN